MFQCCMKTAIMHRDAVMTAAVQTGDMCTVPVLLLVVKLHVRLNEESST